MRFVLGPPPDNPDFTPEEKGWRLVRVPGYGALVAFGSVIGALACATTALGWSHAPGTSADLRIDFGEFGLQVGAIGVALLLLTTGVASFAALVLVHEMLHAFAFPGFGMSRSTILGVWLSRLLPYADHHGPMPCWRFVVAILAPFSLLSVTPLAVAFLTGSTSTFWMLVSVVNALGSGGDVLIVAMVLFQVPTGAMLQNKGWDTWWRPAEPRPAADGGA